MQSRALLRKAIRAVGAHRREAADRVDGGDERDRRAATRRMADGPRRVTLVAPIVLASGFWTTLRTDGMTGDSRHDLTWRWTETAESRLLATTTDERLAPPPKKTTTANEADWPGFRGRNRDSIVRGSRIETDWVKSSPPSALWPPMMRRPAPRGGRRRTGATATALRIS